MRGLGARLRQARAPSRLRALARASEVALIGLAALIGVCGGLLVGVINLATQRLHEALFRLPSGIRLSATPHLDPPMLVLVPALGGLLLGGLVYAAARWHRRPIVDPVEANALHGGRMSIRDSLIVVVQNVVSNGFGASVGLEACYTQISSAVGSRLGRYVEARRADLRVLLGCGAAAAIAAAFSAPLTGAFYAFELIVGTYTIASLAPIAVAALCGYYATHLVMQQPGFVDLGAGVPSIVWTDYGFAAGLGLVCAGFGIAVMQAVTKVEALGRRSRVPAALRPALGGLVVGGLALASPQVLSGGHGALHLDLQAIPGVETLLLLIVLKSLGSIVSLGSGFRGGLFFASLLLGGLLGAVIPSLLALVGVAAPSPVLCAVIGMGALAVTIIGGPMTMTFLALEVTGDLAATGIVLVAVITASVTARKTFGYTFATWRFHLRGESIRSAHDIGWIQVLSVGKMMSRDVRTIRDDTTVATFRRAFPLGSAQRVVVVDNAGRYAGIVLVPEAHVPLEDEEAPPRLADLLRYREVMLTPGMNAKDAMAAFDRSESDALAVVDALDTRAVIGLLTEAHTLRRYSEELDQRRGELSGEYREP